MRYCALMLFLLFAMTSTVFAHPPSGFELEWDPFESILWVTVFHHVNNPAKHYIYKVTIELKGKEIIKQELKTQWNEEEQLVAYQIPDVQQDDKITVTAYCNISGKKKESISVSFEEKPEPDE